MDHKDLERSDLLEQLLVALDVSEETDEMIYKEHQRIVEEITEQKRCSISVATSLAWVEMIQHYAL